jgi:hypothetical protein
MKNVIIETPLQANVTQSVDVPAGLYWLQVQNFGGTITVANVGGFDRYVWVHHPSLIRHFGGIIKLTCTANAFAVFWTDD